MELLRLIGMVSVAAGFAMVTLGYARTAAARRSPLAEIIDDDSWQSHVQNGQPLSARLFGPAKGGLGALGKKLTPGAMLTKMRRHAVLAGIGAGGVESILAIKAVATLTGATILPVTAMASGVTALNKPILLALVGGASGFFLPDLWISRKGRTRQELIRKDLPETIDLMAICVQAGMGLEAAIDLASQTLPGPLGDELYRLLQEIQLGSSRRQALQMLRERTDVNELASFALALIQADATGSPIAEVLQANSARMRMLRRQTAREKAAKLPVKLLFPTLLFIFPALFVVVIGPAGISIFEMFSKA